VGITTGRLLCACVGSRVRSEYTVYGDAINLSARLMMKAKEGYGHVLCDYTTSELASRAARYNKMEQLRASPHPHKLRYRQTRRSLFPDWSGPYGLSDAYFVSHIPRGTFP